MFDLQKYSSRLAIRSDIGESITYAELTVETEKFHDAIPYDGLVFILCENVMGSLLGYISCMTKHIPCVLLDGSKDIELFSILLLSIILSSFGYLKKGLENLLVLLFTNMKIILCCKCGTIGISVKKIKRSTQIYSYV